MLQSEAFENKLAADIAAQIPDVPGFGDMEQKMVAKLAIDACTDKLAEAEEKIKSMERCNLDQEECLSCGA